VAATVQRSAIILLALFLAACGSAPKRSVYYQNDGPPDRAPSDLSAIPDAVPRVEPINPRNSRPYVALGRSFTPLTGDEPLRQRGIASWYGRQFHGNRTANGEIYDMYAMTAAHPTMPLPSYARVTHVASGRSVVVRVNDRGPFLGERVIDLSYAAAMRLGIAGAGTGEVEVERITYAQIAAGDWQGRRVASAPIIDNTPLAPVAALPVVEAAPAGAGAAPDARWSVQLGAFAQQANADVFAAQVASQLGRVEQLEAPMRTPRIERDEGLYRVLIGALPDRLTALSLAEQLQRLLGRPTSLLLR
jgi:rare lipoprotein A